MANGRAVWGIDVGNYSLKALRCLLSEDGRTIVADRFARVRHADHIHEAHAQERDLLIRDTLRKFVSRNKIFGDTVAVCVPGKAGLLRIARLPPVEPAGLPDLVLLHARQNLPSPLEELIWEYQLLPAAAPTPGTRPGCEVGMFAVKGETMRQLLKPLFDERIVPEFVQLAPLCLYNLAVYEFLGERDKTEPAEALVVLSMGVETTDVLITEGARPLVRTIPLGGGHFTQALMKELSLSHEQAERAKRKAGREDSQAIDKALLPVLNDFATQVQRAVGHFRGVYPEIHLGRLMLLGNPARLKGLQLFLSEKLGLKPLEVKAFRRLAGEAVLSDERFEHNILTMGVSYGLCIQGLGQAQLSTNLLPPEYRSGRKRKDAAGPAAGLFGSVSNLISRAFRRGK